MSGWSYQHFNYNSVDDVISHITSILSDITDNESKNALVAYSDIKDHYAKGVVYYTDNNITDNIVINKWICKEFKTSTKGGDESGYDKNLYQPMLNFINGLPENALIHAKMDMSDAKSNDATLTIWYPTA